MSERTQEVARKLRGACCNCDNSEQRESETERFLDSLPEFQEPKWIKCSDEMPEVNVPIYFVGPKCGVMSGGRHGCEWIGNRGWQSESVHHSGVTHWRPRQVPKPPVEEESQLVKEISSKKEPNCRSGPIAWNDALSLAIEIVRRHEKGKQ